MTPPASAAASAAPPVRRGRSTVPTRPRVAPRKPRRVSGPARRQARPIQPPAQAERGLALGVAEALTGLSSHHALDRLIRGRAWIALIAFALIGIVTLQLLVLTLNAHIGRALVHETQLQRENAAYSIENSEMASGERIEAQAARLGMELVPEGAMRFLRVAPRPDIARAAGVLSAPASTPAPAPSNAAPSSLAPAPGAEPGGATEAAPAAAAPAGEAGPAGGVEPNGTG
jgi:hypothetical protein